ncbi:TPA: 2-hydroxycarboxylate transporter family protein, partial [Klebsiella pneumoniae]
MEKHVQLPPEVRLPPAAQDLPTGFWPHGWWKIMEIRIGIIPLPVYFLLLALIVGFVLTGKIPGEISVAIALLAVGGFTCSELGKHIPIVRDIGAAAIFATFIPSCLAFY